MLCANRKHSSAISERTNEMMSFLILLTEEDYVKLPRYCFQSNSQRIVKNRGNFPGILHIKQYSEIGNNEFRDEFIIEGHPIPKQLYVKLAKENVYVPYENYSTKYLNSKLGELRDLFIHLKAKKIKITKTELVDKKLGAGVKVSAANMGGAGAEFEKSSILENEFTEELHFDADNKPIDTGLLRGAHEHRDSNSSLMHKVSAKLHVKPKFYYLKNEYEWEDIIDRRLNNKLVYDKYTYYHSDSRILKASFMNKLKIFDVNIDFENKEHHSLKIEYDIEYHPLVVTIMPALSSNDIDNSNNHKKQDTDKKRSFADMVINVIDIYPKKGMNTPLPSPISPSMNNSNQESEEDASESKKEEPTQEEPKKEEPKQEEPKQEEPKQEEPKQEEPKQEEPKQETKKIIQINELNEAIELNDVIYSPNEHEKIFEDIIRIPDNASSQKSKKKPKHKT
jgi:hypothetical protein